ncbi:T9SS type A sorting domain-containing protein [Hymenobacter taeanensis]|uniref:T9SS type A sorting domain-containing protein n=1 Tax=Hymenobacter taeanensis TaxID=2735321 RepID=A0A6M6BIX8_9BACT|nr:MULTISPECIES: T9SS type A sorting domain-containing protein [Hymenobacter]QJX47959.1 T9SS type A sorting domain-containing protein [Hymenobacter taeanensis]UOQ82594.1 T9SS type A sorting domain-containing protein [Hymenobacter sp. 5414T-23]
MLRPLRRVVLLTSALLGLLPLLGHAQVVQPLSSAPPQPSAPVTARRVQALTLPFFDDFAGQPEGRPNEQHWLTTGGTLVNNRFARRPPSKGVATFDGFTAAGGSYGGVSSFGATDSLTSQPLDLSGLQASDNVFLSFFWQAGTLVGPPVAATSSRPTGLYIDFLDDAGNWREVSQIRSSGDTTNFRFRALPVNQASYLHKAFQFRFRVFGYQYNGRDAWSIDYVRLDRNRSATDSTFRDIALSQRLPSALRQYTAMPVGQFNQNPSQELTPRTRTTINNLDPGPAPTPITITGTLDVLPGGPSTQFLTSNRSLNAGIGGQQQAVVASLQAATVSISAAPKLLRQRITLVTNETNPLTLFNDTLSRTTELADYYAYDDGSAEATLSLPTAATGPVAYYATRYDLNAPDVVRAIRFYPMATALGRTVTVAIWDDASNQPAAAPKATQSFSIPATLPAGQAYVDVPFPTPVAVTGRFYAGYGQASSPQFVEIGVDLNNAPPANYFFINLFNAWSSLSLATTKSPNGALMLRPLMGAGTVTATASATLAASYSVFPNPTSDGVVRVEGRFTRATVLDALGRTVWEQPTAQAGQALLPLQQLRPGVYLVRLKLADGTTITKRLVREQ